MTPSLNSILETRIMVKVVDIGANPIDGEPTYAPLLRNGDAEVVGFEPAPDALAQLNRKKGPRETYLPAAVGDGRPHTLHFCASSGLTSLLQPNFKLLNLLHGFPDWARVVKTEEIETQRLDDIPEVAGFDLLKLDVQGAELMILENAVKGLEQAVCVQTEVEFVPLYVDQPLFADVDRFMRRQGFVLHRFQDLISRVIKPLTIRDDIYAGLSQIFWTDAIYIRDFTRLELLGSDQLLRLAAILNDCYLSVDLVLHLLVEYDRRSGTRHTQVYQERGLGLKPEPPSEIPA